MKRHVLTDGCGVPLSALITGANVHDKWMVAQVLDAVALRTSRGPRRPKHLCLDKGYDYADVEAAVRSRRIIPHIRRRGEQPLVGCIKGKPRRWVVERLLTNAAQGGLRPGPAPRARGAYPSSRTQLGWTHLGLVLRVHSRLHAEIVRRPHQRGQDLDRWPPGA